MIKAGWNPIETAPEGEPHLRGMWVYNAMSGAPIYFAVNCGYIDEKGAFVGMDGDDEFGWAADDYDFWAPIPLPFPKAVKKELNND